MHDENPFINGMKVDRKRQAVSVSPVRHIVNGDGVLTEETARVVVSRPIDGGEFTKLFLFPYHMSGNAVKVFLYLVSKLPFNSTTVYFHPKELTEYQPEGQCYSTKGVYRALAELAHNNIIAKAGKHWLHFNPLYGYRGNRLGLNKDK